MDITKIKINIENTRLLFMVALLMDRIDFLKDVQNLRVKYRIEKLYDSTLDGKVLFYKDISGGNLIKHVTSHKGKVVKEWMERDIDEEKVREFENHIYRLRTKYRRGINYHSVVRFAVISNEIPKDCFYTCKYMFEQHSQYLYDTDESMPVIALFPDSTKEDLIHEFEKYEVELNKSLSAKSRGKLEDIGYWYLSDIAYETFDSRDTIQNIRNWYWERYGEYFNNPKSKPKSYKKVGDATDANVGYDNIRHQLDNYIKQLKATPKSVA